MKFTIRSMLLLTTVVALALLIWTKHRQRIDDMQTLTTYLSQIQSLRATLAVDRPRRHQAILAAQDESESSNPIRERAVEHFEYLREKYGKVTPRDPNTVSFRVIPSLQVDEKQPALRFRLWIPTDRPVWLKCGVVSDDDGGPLRPAEESLLRDTPFTRSGPFEARLSPGETILEFHSGTAMDGQLPIALRVGEEMLLQTTYVSPDIKHAGLSYISAKNQYDSDSQRRLPGLINVPMKIRAGQTEHTFKIWLDDTSGGFASIPHP